MIPAIIRASLANRFVILVLAVMMGVAGIWAIRETPVDAIPDLSDVQVIVRTPYPGQAPQVVENQITYPLATSLLAVPTVLSMSFSKMARTCIGQDPASSNILGRSPGACRTECPLSLARMPPGSGGSTNMR